MTTATPFGSDYQDARSKFLSAARAADARIESIPYPARGPKDEELALDIAWIGAADAPNVLVLQSAMHGVEGFCGSGAQVDWLLRGEATRLPAGSSALLVHAINPYGFAWLRRVTHENIDLNRNWIDFTGPVPENSDYSALQAWIVPAAWDDQLRAETRAVFDAYGAAHGHGALVQGLSGGQYQDSRGIFYGGIAPAWSRTALTQVYSGYLSAAHRIVVLDFHTALGPYGLLERMCMAPVECDVYRRATTMFGTGVTSVASGASSSAVLTGDALSAIPAILPHAEVTAVTLEYGTLPPLEVLDAVRADAWLHAHGDPDSPLGRSIKRQMRDAFYCDSDIWRGMVLGQSLLSIHQAVAYLSSRHG